MTKKKKGAQQAMALNSKGKVDQLADLLAMAMLRAGYTQFMDERVLRPLRARKEVGGRGAKLVMEGSLDRVALVGKVPRVDYTPP